MVRRRTRTKVASVGSGALLEDQYIASPKRKDCKIENGVSELYSASNSVALTALPMGEELKLNSKNKAPFARIRVDRGGDFAEGTTGLPHGTRSQAKITESFFKSNTGTKNSKLKDVEEFESNSTYSSSKPNYSDLQFETVVEKRANQDLQISQTSMLPSNTSHMQHDLIFGFIENASTNNIFLQQPVLKLNIDKTPNQASSITIKRSIETDPVFSSPPLLTAPTFNVGANQIISLDSFSFASKVMLLPDMDSSSCDSGIAFTTSLDNNSSVTEIAGGSPTRRRKPATPHRIVCPSPIKAPSRALTDEGTCISTSVRNFTAAKEQLSPRKSQRHVVITASKTRRRLNQSDDKAPCIAANANTTMPSNCKQDVHLFENAHNRGHDENLKDVEARHATMPPSDVVGNKNLNASGKGQFKSHIVKAQQPKTKNKTSQPLATTNCNRELTEFFPVRRSIRKTKTAVKEEMMKNLEQAILEERAEGLKVAHFEGKGRGIVSDRRFQRGEFVVEYEGDLISMLEASEREKRYALDENAGCYMYYFKHKNQQYCIDATVDTGKLGRLVNHSRNGNLMTKVVVVKQRPHLILIAKDDIELGEELTYDYGDRSKESLMHHPWLAF